MYYNDIVNMANLMIEYGWSVRVIADNTSYSKSSVHRALTHDLRFIDDDLYWQCKTIMKKHKEDVLRDRAGKFIKRN